MGKSRQQKVFWQSRRRRSSLPFWLHYRFIETTIRCRYTQLTPVAVQLLQAAGESRENVKGRRRKLLLEPSNASQINPSLHFSPFFLSRLLPDTPSLSFLLKITLSSIRLQWHFVKQVPRSLSSSITLYRYKLSIPPSPSELPQSFYPRSQ